MTRRVRLVALVAVGTALGAASAFRPSPHVPGMTDLDRPGPPAGASDEEGYPIENETIVSRCARCHERDDAGRMTRISYERKTPEGWQTSLRRMIALNNVRIEPAEAREVVRYLANRQGLAPAELEPGRFEVERRLIDHDYEGDDQVERTCIACHSMGRVITQRRTKEEWALLVATHRGLYPLVDFQGFRRFGPPDDDQGGSGDARHPMDKAIDHLAAAFPLRTPEWAAWSATMRPPRLAGRWVLEGFEPGRGPLYGIVEIAAGRAPDEFTTAATYVYAEGGESVRRTGQAIVYTGFQWRGRSNPDADDELREVMTVERGWDALSGRWFRGAYDEFGPDVRLRRIGGEPTIAGVHPPSLARGGGTVEVTVYGANLPGNARPADFDFGPGVRTVSVVRASGQRVTLRVEVDAGAPVGARDLFIGRAGRPAALVVHDGVDRISVVPRAGMARIGGANVPKGHQTFDAIGWDHGPDGEAETADDLELGRVPVSWSLEEYAATYEDDDVAFVGRLGPDGVFVPAVDGPNPERRGHRNNVGDVWVVATYAGPAADPRRPLRARANLIVTVPLYVRFDPWHPVPPTELVP